MTYAPFSWIRVVISFRKTPLGRISRSEEHTSELQSRSDLVCRLLLEKKKKILVYAIELRTPDRGLEDRHPVVEADAVVHDAAVAAETAVLDRAGALCQDTVTRAYHAT